MSLELPSSIEPRSFLISSCFLTPTCGATTPFSRRVLSLFSVFSEDGISIPCKYTSYFAPMSAAKMHHSIGLTKDAKEVGRPLLFVFFACSLWLWGRRVRVCVCMQNLSYLRCRRSLSWPCWSLWCAVCAVLPLVKTGVWDFLPLGCFFFCLFCFMTFTKAAVSSLNSNVCLCMLSVLVHVFECTLGYVYVYVFCCMGGAGGADSRLSLPKLDPCNSPV